MQAQLFSTITAVVPQIEFDCEMNGKELTACLTHREDNGLQTLYHVCFSDGHKDIYVPGDEEVQEGFGRTRTPDAYEEAVFEDLCVIPGLEKGERYTYVRVHQKGGESFNVWVRERKGFYSVYYHGRYQFTLRKKERWEESTMREKGYVINKQLAHLVSQHLDLHAS